MHWFDDETRVLFARESNCPNINESHSYRYLKQRNHLSNTMTGQINPFNSLLRIVSIENEIKDLLIIIIFK